jgi:hypothetical protein
MGQQRSKPALGMTFRAATCGVFIANKGIVSRDEEGVLMISPYSYENSGIPLGFLKL